MFILSTLVEDGFHYVAQRLRNDIPPNTAYQPVWMCTPQNADLSLPAKGVCDLYISAEPCVVFDSTL